MYPFAECELGVYKSVPAPRQLGGAAEGPADPGRRAEHPLSGSEPALADLAGRLASVTAQVTVRTFRVIYAQHSRTVPFHHRVVCIFL